MTDSVIYEVCRWLTNSGLATHIRESDNLFSLIESVHTLSIVAVVGIIAAVDLRVLGVVLVRVPFAQILEPLTRLVWLGFFIMAASGVLLAISEATKLFGNTAFRLKLALLGLAAVNAWWFQNAAARHPTSGAPTEVSGAMRAAALGSLSLWTGVIVCGRAIAYL